MIYILCFLLSILFCFLANKKYENKKKFYIFSILAIIIPVLLATFRGLEVGTDLKVYLYPAFLKATSISKFSVFTQKIDYMIGDKLVQMLVFFSAKIFNDFNYLLFFIQLIICSFFYFGSYNFREKANPAIIYSMFLFVFYNMSLNLIRQFITMSILFYAFKYMKKEKIKFFIALIIAYLCHKTAIIGVLILILYITSKSKYKYLFTILTVFGLIFSLVFYSDILSLLANLQIIPEVYVLRYSLDIGNTNANLIDTLFFIYIIVISLIKGKKENNDDYDFLFLMNAIALILMQVGSLVPYGNRLSYYFEMFSFVLLANVIKNCKREKKFVTILTFIVILVYFIYIYLICQNGETYPYIFYNY